jgi:hypothetical protein
LRLRPVDQGDLAGCGRVEGRCHLEDEHGVGVTLAVEGQGPGQFERAAGAVHSGDESFPDLISGEGVAWAPPRCVVVGTREIGDSPSNRRVALAGAA